MPHEERMSPRIVPMIHVPNVQEAMEWYARIGFVLEGTSVDDGQVTWAAMSLGSSQIMLNAGGRTSDAPRREVDLYIHTEDIDSLHERINSVLEQAVEPVEETFYGNREFTIRDLNGFWLTFGQSVRGE